jgi:hypothetical protein
MGKNRGSSRTPSRAQPEVRRWPLGLRIFVSLLVTFHVIAVFVGPWSAIPEQASPLAQNFRQYMSWYIDPLYLSNGYRFFAPEPGPSHLVRYEVTRRDGKVVRGRFPDRETEWPRLLYHRYFMLSETINSMRPPRSVPARERLTYDLYVRSYARHLARQFDARQVKLFLMEHAIPSIEAIQSGKIALTQEHTYQELPLGTFAGDEL